MIEKIYELAKIVNAENEDYFKIAKLPPVESGHFIVLNLDGKEYMGLKISEKVHSKSLLYIDQKGNVKGKSPTVILRNSKPEDVEKGIEKLIKFFDAEGTEDVYDMLSKNKKVIIQDLCQRSINNSFVSILVEKDEKELLPADINEIRKIFVKKNLGGSRKRKDRSKCFLCGEVGSVSPRLSEIFRFSTFDKPGYTTGLSGRSEEVLSVCDTCYLELREVRNFIDENLSFTFFGDTLWIIPSGNETAVKRIVEELKDLDIYSDISRRAFSQSERVIEKKLGENEELTYDFVVLSISRNEEKMLLHITEIPPSRFRTILENAERLKGDIGLDPNLANIREFFKTQKVQEIGQEVGKIDFYKLVKAIFSGEKFSKFLILSYMMRWIRSKIFSGEQDDLVSCGKRIFSSYVFLMRIGTLEGGKKMDGERFFEKYNDFFDAEWKKAVFLIGVLTGCLIDYQRKEKGSMPFVKKLKGLKMSKKDVESLFPEIKAKILQYNDDKLSERLKVPFELATKYILDAGNWEASVDEINFVFTTGMAFFQRFIKEG